MNFEEARANGNPYRLMIHSLSGKPGDLAYARENLKAAIDVTIATPSLTLTLTNVGPF